MERIFFVQGSEPEPYKVTFIKDGLNLSCYCTCMAGQNGLYCKHRFNLLDGITKNLVSKNVDEVGDVVQWLAGTDVEEALMNVRKIEKEQDEIKRKLKVEKKQLARAMRD